MSRPTRIQITGLFGNHNIDLAIDGNALILVGPNGIGKSTVSSIFYYFISRQWRRLLQFQFREVAVWFGSKEVRASHGDISGVAQFERAMGRISPSSKVTEFIEEMQKKGLLHVFLGRSAVSPAERRKVMQDLNMPQDEFRQWQMRIRRLAAPFDDDEFLVSSRTNIDEVIDRSFGGRMLFLPTYRRIEKDIQEIFPDFETRISESARIHSPFTLRKSNKNYVDLVSFGMEDVRTSLENKSRFLRDYSLSQFNDLSGLYLRDVIQGKADQYSQKQIMSLDDASVQTILSRVSEQVLTPEDKSLLISKISEIRQKKKREMEVNDLYLAHYFSRLVVASADISKQESDIIEFVKVCNAYLGPSKSIVYDETKFSVEIFDRSGRPLDLSMLSSGEKQVISLFSHLYLDDVSEQFVVIDEPELSLSVPWQKRFLIDILDSKHCDFLLAVTHSPFIYQNSLKLAAVDLRRMTQFSAN